MMVIGRKSVWQKDLCSFIQEGIGSDVGNVIEFLTWMHRQSGRYSIKETYDLLRYDDDFTNSPINGFLEQMV